MRIVHVYKDYLPVVGGIENHIRYLAEAQAARGHDVTVLVTSRNRRGRVETRNGVRVIFSSRLFNLSSAPISLELFQRVRQLAAEIVHLHSPYPVGEMAALFGQTRALVLTYHSDIVRQRMMGALYAPILYRVLARVNLILATSPNYIESSPALRHWKEKCVIVPLGIPPPPSPSIPSPRAQPNQLLFVGQLRYYKGVNYLLEALALMPNVSLTVVGEGPMEREWKALAQELGIAPRVMWAGRVSDAELPTYYAACQVFVLPCSERSEAFGTVQLEAMAAGKPIVSCDVNTGVAWVNQDGATGLVVSPKHPRALANAITALLEDNALREQMGNAGRERFQTEFTLARMVERVMQVYQRTLDGKP